MGQSKGGGYDQRSTLLPEQLSSLLQMLQQAQGNTQQASEAYKGFLPGGKGAEAITQQAQQQYKQNTIPSILNQFGSGSKTSSALNQALAASGSDLNTNLASMLSKLQLDAASGLAGLGSNQQSIGLGTPAFAFQEQQRPAWQSWVSPAIQAAGTVGGAYLGGPAGAAAGNKGGELVANWLAHKSGFSNRGV